jgi:hypothetical protein
MSDKNKLENDQNKRKTILSTLFNKGDRDTTYRPDLQAQWSRLDPHQRVQFILGGVVGLVLLLGALLLAFFLLSNLFA